ncbi:MAG: hypothetical protein EP305_12220 [Bacteroidetes bacterium]|nr:MAG: hypothetical protein EP305_12220 [Bacteroidota bacterium]
MIVYGSITGLFKTLFILIGVFVVLRFIGQLMIAKRNIEEERKLNRQQKEADRQRNEKLKNFGKVNILGKTKQSSSVNYEAEEVDFEEID